MSNKYGIELQVCGEVLAINSTQLSTLSDERIRYLASKGVCLLEDRVQRFSEKTGQPVEPIPYTILTSLKV